MNKIAASILILLFSTIFCAKNSSNQLDDPRDQPAPSNENNLIISDEFLEFSKHKVTFIELGADQCIPCKAMQPVMYELAQEYKGTIQVVFYDIWKNPEIGQHYGIRMIPTQIFIDKSGQEIFRHVGFYAKEAIIEMLKGKHIL